jgi:hypothetical protein
MARPKIDEATANEVRLDLRVDPNRLDDAWLNQPGLYFEYAEELASAKRELESLKTELDLVKAETDLAIRANPEEYELSKTTEAMVASTVLQQKGVREAQRHVIDARHRVDVLQAAVTAVEHRKALLQNMVQLHLANYFSTPRVSGEAKEMMDKVEKKSVRRGRRRG